MSCPARLILASASPRRSLLLQQLRLPFSVQSADIDEATLVGESPTDYVRRLALAKALTVQRGLDHAARQHGHVLAADTTVVCAGQILGKPDDALTAVKHLRRLSGRSHQVLTAVSLVGPQSMQSRLQISTVTMMALTDQEISRYVATGEPMGKAGAYAIQGLAAAFITRLDGSYSGVMGLPLADTARLLRSAQLLTF